MPTLIDNTKFRFVRNGVEATMGAIFYSTPLERPMPDDFKNVCNVVSYYAKQLRKAVPGKVRKLKVCGDDFARELVSEVDDGYFVAECKKKNNGYNCQLLFFAKDELEV